MKNKNTELFENMPVKRAVISLVVPTILSQMVTVLYNMADTFFIGQIGDPDQVAAAALSLPLFMLFNGVANLFGIGGASLISRSLGVDDKDKAAKAAVFSIWTSAVIAVAYGIVIYALKGIILPKVGANSDTYIYCTQYVFWTITIGGLPTVMNMLLAHLVRAEGNSRQASFGMALGGIMNIILDPVFIFGLKMNVAGAAAATMLSNLIATVYFVVFIIKRRGVTTISFNPRHYTLGDKIPFEILMVGLPSCAMNLLAVFSNITLNTLMAGYCNEAIAGVGIAKKIDMLAFAIATGMSQGVLPLIGYNYSAKNYKRMMESIKTTFVYSMVISVAGTVFLLTCAGPLVRAFIDDPLTVQYGQLFQRIICISTPCVSVTMIIITMFQSVGKKVQPLCLSLLRKGGLDIPFMFLMNSIIGVNGIVWATPVADLGAMILSVTVFIPFWKKIKTEQKSAEI